MRADLHLHTTESDGTWTPKQLVEEAFKRGLAAIAITDHDTTAGIEEALTAAPEGFSVIPGIELSAVAEDGEEVHMLGLWINPQYPPLQRELTLLREERYERTAKMIDRLAELGMAISYNEVLLYAKKDIISRSHIASALLAKGFVTSKQEAFEKWIGQGCPAYVERLKLSPERAIALILESGGVPVLAHPGLLKNLDILPSLVQAGLVGLEVIHSTHTPAQTHFFLGLARTWELLPSGGSDCHGPGGKDQLFLGKYSIPLEWSQALSQVVNGKR